MWPGRTTKEEQRAFLRGVRSGEAPPYAPPIVRKYPALYLREYEQAFHDGFSGLPPRRTSVLYLSWYEEGRALWEFSTLLADLS
jgi:hypothetical protein